MIEDRRAAVYVRVSTDEQVRFGVSLDAQEARCRAYCAAVNLPVVTCIREEGVSGGTLLDRRPGGERLMHMLKVGEATAVVALKLDRLFRSVTDALTRATAWDNAGISVHLVDHGGNAIDTSSATGRLFFTIMAGFAEHERGVIGERVTLALDRIASTGRKPNGYSYGYRAAQGQLPEVYEPEAEVVREAFRRLVAGEGVCTIARDFTERRIPRPKSRQGWSAAPLRVLLTNPEYVGRFQWAGEVRDGMHPAIIDEATFARAQAIFAAHATGRTVASGRVSGLLVCGICGGPMVSLRSGGTGGSTYPQLRCYRRLHAPEEERHDPVHVSEPKVTEGVWRHTELLLSEASIQDMIHRVAEARRDGAVEERALRKRKADLDGMIARGLALENAGAPVDVVMASLAPLIAEREQVQSALAGLVPEADLADLRALAKPGTARMLRRLRAGSVVNQSVFMQSIYARVEVLPGELLFVHRLSAWPDARRELPRYWGPTRGGEWGW